MSNSASGPYGSAKAASKSQVALGHLGLFYAAAIWGSTFFIVKGVLADIDPVMLVSYRFLIAGGLMLIYLWATGRKLTHMFGKGMVLAIILLLLYVTQTVGLQYTTASNSGFITGLFVAFVPLFLKTVFRRNPTLMELVASVISLSGLWVLTGGMREANFGDILTLAAAVTYALHVLYADKYVKEGVDPWVVTCQQCLVIGVLSFGLGVATGRPLGIQSTGAMWVVVFLAIFPTMTAFVIQVIAQKFISPLRVSLVFAFEPVFAGVFAWTLGGEQFVLHGAIGGLLIFIGLVTSALPTPGFLKRAQAPVGRT